jgi:hypothetical protein
MNKILLLLGIVTLLTTTGCLVAEDGGGHRYERHDGPGEVVVAPPVVVPVVRVEHN